MVTAVNEDRCSMPRCRGVPHLDYLGNPLCERHWNEQAAEEGEPLAHIADSAPSSDPDKLPATGFGASSQEAGLSAASLLDAKTGAPQGAQTSGVDSPAGLPDTAELEEIRHLGNQLDQAIDAFKNGSIKLASHVVRLGKMITGYLDRTGTTKKTLADRLGRHPSWVTRVTKASEHVGPDGPRTLEDASAILRIAHGNA